MKNLNTKVAVVTGGGGGIGGELCAQLAEAGCTVAVCDLDLATAKRTADRIADAGGQATAHQVDVAAEASVRELVAEVLERHQVVDVLVNNAGVSAGPAEASADRLDDFRRIVEINLWGVVHGSLLFLPALRSRPAANLVNVTSYTGIIGVPSVTGYSTSKFAARGFTESLRMELAGGPVAVSLVVPGVTHTSLMLNSPLIAPDAKAGLHASFTKSPGIGPDKVARQIVKGIRANRPRILTGADTRALDLLVRLAPGGYTRLLHRPMKSMLERTLAGA